MSVTGQGKTFPNSGNLLPAGGDERAMRVAYAQAIARALKQELGGTVCAAKTVMRWTGASERCVKHWLAGTCGPSGEHLLALLRQSDAVLNVVLQLAGRRRLVAGTTLLAARHRIAESLEAIDTLLE